MTNSPQTYEHKSDVIDGIIERHRYIWQLRAIRWMDYEDVAQIIRAHIAKKWPMWQQDKPIEPWVARITSNQIKNLLRNNYSNYVRPCLSCPHAVPGDPPSCMITNSGVQCSECPLYAKWEKTKKGAYNVKLSLSLDAVPDRSFMTLDKDMSNVDILACAAKLHEKMKERLGGKQYKVYSMLYIDGLEDEDVAKEMGYKTTESGKKAGYKQIKNLKKLFREVAADVIDKEDIILNNG